MITIKINRTVYLFPIELEDRLEKVTTWMGQSQYEFILRGLEDIIEDIEVAMQEEE